MHTFVTHTAALVVGAAIGFFLAWKYRTAIATELAAEKARVDAELQQAADAAKAKL